MKNKKDAFTLIEVVWAVLILSVIIVTVTGIFTGIFVSSKKSKKIVVATNLARKQLEYIKLMGFSYIPLRPVDKDGRNNGVIASGTAGHYFPPFPIPPAPLREVVDGVTYYYRIQAKDISGTGGKLVNITVTVYWDKKADEKSGKNFVVMGLYKAE